VKSLKQLMEEEQRAIEAKYPEPGSEDGLTAWDRIKSHKQQAKEEEQQNTLEQITKEL
jgi:hypothetical protein